MTISSIPGFSGVRNSCSPFFLHSAAAAKSLQSCPTLCDPIDGTQSAHKWKLPQPLSLSFSPGSRVTIHLRVFPFFLGPVCKLILNLFHISHIVLELRYFKATLIKWFCFIPDHGLCTFLSTPRQSPPLNTSWPKWLVLYLYMLMVCYGSLLCLYVPMVYSFPTYYFFILSLDCFCFFKESCLTYFLVESNLEDYSHACNMAHWCQMLQRILSYFLFVLTDFLHA